MGSGSCKMITVFVLISAHAIIVHGLVALPLPEYIEPSNRISRYCHSMTFRQLQTSTNYYKYSFFPLAIVQWNALPADVACLPDLESFKVAVSKQGYCWLEIVRGHFSKNAQLKSLSPIPLHYKTGPLFQN